MWQLFSGTEPWFRPRMFGYGPGLPIAWQGWAVSVSYVAAVAGLTVMLEWARGVELAGVLAALGLLTVLYVILAKARTRGEWRWRWGEDS